jgi:hypothetical protein
VVEDDRQFLPGGRPAVHPEVAGAVEKFAGLLLGTCAGDGQVSPIQAFILAWFPSLSSESLPLLRSACLDGSPHARASGWLARGILGDVDAPGEDEHETVLLASAIAACESRGPTSEALDILRTLTGHPLAACLNEDRQPFFGGDLVEYAKQWLRRAGCLSS